MAQIKKRGLGWSVRLQWRDATGKRHTSSKSGFKTKRLAQVWAVEHEARLNAGVAIDKTISLTNYFRQWVDTYKRPKLSRVSLERYDHLAVLIDKYFGQTPIKEITRPQYQQFINQYGRQHAPSSVQKTNGFIRACVKSAILDDYLTKDFTQNVTLTANKSRTVEVEYLNRQEIKLLIKEAYHHLDPNYTSRYMIITAIYTGMRKEEIQALTWKDINFSSNTIKITKAYDERSHNFKATKNPSSVRTIKANAELLKILSDLKHHTTSTMVFLNCLGTIPTSNALNKELRKLLKQAHIDKRGFHFHSLRHSHVALLLAKGIDIYAISKRLGHNNITTTVNTYSYLMDEYRVKVDQEIISALADLDH